LREFADSGSSRLLLDLRGNPGGYLNASIDMASWFLPSGKVVVTEDYGENHEPEIYRSRGYDVFSDNLKLVILIDEGSASASEILAGALRSHGKAKLVGTQSFGKGSVQEVIDVTSSTILKITVAKWLTPDGTSLSEKGLTPDYVVEMTKKDIEEKRDPQMDKAVEVLLNWK
jgi:carboxyl-terminal processing protease